MKNRIKEQKLYLLSNHTSSKEINSNQFILLLSGIAYILLEAIRRICLNSTKYPKATRSTIRLKLLKIDAIIVRKTKTIKISLSSSYSLQNLFETVLKKLDKVIQI